jgi:hypothetical protein
VRSRPELTRLALPVGCVALAAAILAPLLGRGVVLAYDMVFAPRQSLLPDGLGLGSAPPRAVPSDAVVALATTVVPGDIVQKLALAVALFGAALGAGLLVPAERVATRLVAAVTYGWSAYVAERLFIGHWQLLLSYACLPWIIHTGLTLRRGEHRAAAMLVLACLPAVLTPTGGLMAAGAAVAAAGVRRLPVTAGVAIVLNAPWWVPAVLSGTGLSTPDGVTAFAARAESWGGPVVSLLGLGGIWNAEVVPASRAVALTPAVTVIVAGIALLGLRVLVRRWGAGPARAVILLGAGGLVLAALPTLPGGAALMRWLTGQVPGAGLLRDSQRWVAWWAPALALGFALAVEAATARLRTEAGRRALFVGAALLPVVVLPDLAWAGLGRLATVDYPNDWQAVRAVLAADGQPGDVFVLPLGSFRRFGWNAERTQLDPAPRALPRTVVVDDTLLVGGRPIPGEDRRAAGARQALAGRGDLAALGFGWLLVEHGTPGPDARLPDGATEVYRGPWLTLYRLGGSIAAAPAGAPRIPVLAADLAAILLVTLSVLWWSLPTGRLARNIPPVTKENPCA